MRVRVCTVVDTDKRDNTGSVHAHKDRDRLAARHTGSVNSNRTDRPRHGRYRASSAYSPVKLFENSPSCSRIHKTDGQYISFF